MGGEEDIKRLKHYLLGVGNGPAGPEAAYEGETVEPAWVAPRFLEFSEYTRDPVYWHGSNSYEFLRSGAQTPDLPNITVRVVAGELFAPKPAGGEKGDPATDANKGEAHLKRLKYYFHLMENDTATYRYKEGIRQRDIYDGDAYVANALPEPEDVSDPMFWQGAVSYALEKTNKLVPDLPTVTVNLPAEDMGIRGLPAEDMGIRGFTAAAADFCLRAFTPYIDELNAGLCNRSRPDTENGRYYLQSLGGEVLVRNGAYFALCPQKDYDNGPGNAIYLKNDGVSRPPLICLCIKMQVQLPRKKLLRAVQMLTKDLPDAVERFAAQFDPAGLEKALELAAKQQGIRAWLRESPCCAFIANGSILPREKGTQAPMKNAVPFRSVPEDEVEICGVRGMGIKRGVTVITGGGYSGKSTLLDAIAAGIYDHAAGDGRELCITDESAVSISAEDARSVKRCNISPFIKWIPGGDPADFSTDRASGSTSQAANIMEAVNAGARLLLIDEDRSATNFMIRDQMMKELIEKEPITPFTERAEELFRDMGVSTILVIGGSGEYLSVAGKIYLMDDFLIGDATARAKAICSGAPKAPLPAPVCWSYAKTLLAEGFSSYPEGSGTERLEISDMGFILIGDEQIDIRMFHNIVSKGQRNALGFMLRALEVSRSWERADIAREIDALYGKIEKEGPDCVFSNFFTSCGRFFDLPRRQELLALINRMRRVRFAGKEGG